MSAKLFLVVLVGLLAAVGAKTVYDDVGESYEYDSSVCPSLLDDVGSILFDMETSAFGTLTCACPSRYGMRYQIEKFYCRDTDSDPYLCFDYYPEADPNKSNPGPKKFKCFPQ